MCSNPQLCCPVELVMTEHLEHRNVSSRAEIASTGELRVTVRNITRDSLIGNRIEVAGSNAKRSKGLLGRRGLPDGGGMWIVPCEAIHTFFMRFSIDLVYLDRKNRVKKTRAAVPAWRMSACLSAHSVLELPAGTIQQSRTEAGDVLEIEHRHE